MSNKKKHADGLYQSLLEMIWAACIVINQSKGKNPTIDNLRIVYNRANRLLIEIEGVKLEENSKFNPDNDPYLRGD